MEHARERATAVATCYVKNSFVNALPLVPTYRDLIAADTTAESTRVYASYASDPFPECFPPVVALIRPSITVHR